MLRTARPYQQAVIDTAPELDRLPLFHQMRLGKCLTLLRWLREKKLKRVLLVAPKTTIPGWLLEMEMEGIQGTWIQGTRDKREALAQGDGYFLIGYEALRATPSLLSQEWCALCLDESTYIRNPKAQITKLLHRGARNIDTRAILTGLPNPHDELDFVCQYVFLYGNFLGCRSYWSFVHHHYNKIGHELWPKAGTVKAIKEEVHASAFILTRKQAGIGEEKIFETRYVEPSKALEKYYRSALKDFALGRKETKWSVVLDNWLHRLSGGFLPQGTIVDRGKLQELRYLLDGELRKEQVVIWFNYNLELIYALSFLKQSGFICTHINGKVPATERFKRCQEFNKGKYHVILNQIKSVRFGMDCSGASTAIYYSNSMDYEYRAQSMDRIVRVGKKDPLLFIDLVMRRTHDEKVVELLKERGVTSKFYLSAIREDFFRRVAECQKLVKPSA